MNVRRLLAAAGCLGLAVTAASAITNPPATVSSHRACTGLAGIHKIRHVVVIMQETGRSTPLG